MTDPQTWTALGILATAVLALAGVLAIEVRRGQDRHEARLDAIDQRLQGLDARLTKLPGDVAEAMHVVERQLSDQMHDLESTLAEQLRKVDSGLAAQLSRIEVATAAVTGEHSARLAALERTAES